MPVAAFGVLIVSTGTPPVPASLPAAPAPTDQVGPSGDATATPDGTWSISQGGSTFVGYRASEILGFDFLRGPNEAVGRTTAVNGTMTIHAGALTELHIAADISQLRSDQEARDGHIREYLDLSSHREATLDLAGPVALPAATRGAIVHVTVPARLSVLGASGPVSFLVDARWNGATVEATGHTAIRRSAFGIDAPQLVVFRVADEITLEFQAIFGRPTACPSACATSSASPVAPSGPPPSSAPSSRPLPTIPAQQLPSVTIAFLASDDESEGHIVTASTASSTTRQLTNTPGVFDEEPSWSPNGTLIAFTRVAGDNPPSIWIADMRSGNARQLAGSDGLRSPSWSLDGRFVVAAGAAPDERRLVILDLAGHVARDLSTGLIAVRTPRFAPDGSAIVFSGFAQKGDSEDIYRVRPDGSAQERLTATNDSDYAPTWSPDGSRILFVRAGDLWVMDAAGGRPERLTVGQLLDSPSYTPDGRWIVATGNDGSLSPMDAPRTSVRLIRADGSQMTRLDYKFRLAAGPAPKPR